MKILALDVGEKRIGVAATDDSGIIARPLFSVSVDHEILTNLGKVVDEEHPEKIILGIPRHQSGEEGMLAEQIREFAKVVEHEFNVQIDFEDESGTSIEAERRLSAQGLNPMEIKENVDAEAAAVILESYLART